MLKNVLKLEGLYLGFHDSLDIYELTDLEFTSLMILMVAWLSDVRYKYENSRFLSNYEYSRVLFHFFVPVLDIVSESMINFNLFCHFLLRLNSLLVFAFFDFHLKLWCFHIFDCPNTETSIMCIVFNHLAII